MFSCQIILMIVLIGLVIICLGIWYRSLGAEFFSNTTSSASTTISIPNISTNSGGKITASTNVAGKGFVANFNPNGSITILDPHGRNIYTGPPSNNLQYTLSLDDKGRLTLTDSSGKSKTIDVPK
jgi:hypothetical protein